jgi:Family of unknown function (DUF5990)
VTVGLQRRSDVVDEHPSDDSDTRRVLDVDVTDAGDFRDPFRRVKLMLDAVPAGVLRAARGATLIADVALSMHGGTPPCVAVRPPQITWKAEAHA